MTTLHDRLTDLAGDVPVAPAEPDLWDRGRRLGRQRRGTQVIASVTAVLVVALGVGWWQQRPEPVRPASADNELWLPDEFFVPSPWLPGTDEEGPIGPLVAVLGAERKSWSGSDTGLVGVSGATGDYRFLDLPDAALRVELAWEAADPALSPDGRHLAFWTSSDSSAEHGQIVDGVAVYDTVSGEVDRHGFDTRWGISPEGLHWTAGTLWVDAWRYVEADRTGAHAFRVVTWSAASKEWAPTKASVSGEIGSASSFDEDQLSLDGRTVTLRREGGRPEVYRLDSHVEVAVLGPGDRIAVVLDRDGPSTSTGERMPVAVGTLGTGRPVHLHRLPGVSARTIAGWRAADTIVVPDGPSGTLDGTSTLSYLAVSTETGEETTLTRQPHTSFGPPLQVARDAWAAPTYDAPHPDAPWDPRVVTGIGIGVVVAGGIAMIVWRRRVRP